MSHPKTHKREENEQDKNGNIDRVKTTDVTHTPKIMTEIISGVNKRAMRAAKIETKKNILPEDVNEAVDIVGRITEYLKNSRVQEATNLIVEELDNPANITTYAAMNAIRKRWENQTPATQKIAVLTLPAFGFLAKTGLLPIKGASREELRDTGKWIGPALKWGVAIGSMKWPELKELEPFIAPFIKLMDVESEIFITAYDYMQERRDERSGLKAINALDLGSD